MYPSLVSVFRKQTSCPSAEMLLCYHSDELSAHQRERVASHLNICEFCEAELQLLTEYPASWEECPRVEMPLNLRLLAEALLHGDLKSVEVYAEAAYDKEPLTLTDA
ncbi:MAG TPA: hypothetical protein VM911_15710 [Pyrinomonadaceae bacterium]|jgi:hypothetical protein|nr:hypothetical protein [Pyrinomonadaceae bacterium]